MSGRLSWCAAIQAQGQEQGAQPQGQAPPLPTFDSLPPADAQTWPLLALVLALGALSWAVLASSGAPQESPRRPGFAALARLRDLVAEPFVPLTAAHLVVLGLGLPVLSVLPAWFFPFQPKALGPWWLVLALACAPIAGWCAVARLRRPMVAVTALVALGFALQHGFAWSEGRGLDGMRDRNVATGHAEFAVVAARQPSTWDVLVDYEHKLKSGELGLYAFSKPPGQLLFYVATDRLARFLSGTAPAVAVPATTPLWGPDMPADPGLEAARTLAALLWPLLSYLALFPLYFALRDLAGDAVARLGCLLYVFVPAVTLITLHADQVLFPLQFVAVIAFATAAQRRHSLWWAVAGGVALYAAGFCSFQLLLAGPVAVVCAAAVEAGAGATGPPAPGDRRRALLRTLLGIAVGFGLAFAAVAIVCHYDLLLRLRDAQTFHQSWKQWHGDAREVAYYALLDSVEFGVWLGLPVAVLAGRRMRSAMFAPRVALGLPALALLLVLLHLALFGHTKAETGRLWIPLMPLCCGLAAAELNELVPPARGPRVAVLLLLQWLTILLTKAMQDFR